MSRNKHNCYCYCNYWVRYKLFVVIFTEQDLHGVLSNIIHDKFFCNFSWEDHRNFTIVRPQLYYFAWFCFAYFLPDINMMNEETTIPSQSIDKCTIHDQSQWSISKSTGNICMWNAVLCEETVTFDLFIRRIHPSNNLFGWERHQVLSLGISLPPVWR